MDKTTVEILDLDKEKARCEAEKSASQRYWEKQAEKWGVTIAEAHRLYQKEWRDKNPDKIKKYRQNRIKKIGVNEQRRYLQMWWAKHKDMQELYRRNFWEKKAEKWGVTVAEAKRRVKKEYRERKKAEALRGMEERANG